MSSPPIERGQLLISAGKILSIGPQSDPPPVVDQIVDVDGWVVPGFIDCGSDLGLLGRPSEEWSELTPEVRALDAVDVEQTFLRRALDEGITAWAAAPGPRNVIGGLGAVLRTGAARLDPPAALLAPDAFVEVSLSSAAAAGNFNLRASRPFTYTFRIPNTRMGVVFLARRALLEALGLPDPEALPALLTRGGRDILRAAAGGKPDLRIYADEEQEILAALRLAEELKLKIQIVGGAEASAQAERLAAAGVPVLLYPGTTPRDLRPAEHPRHSPRCAAILARTGVRFAFASQDGREVPLLRTRVAMSLRGGLSAERALVALTLDAARILGIEGRVGSLEVGKDADLAAFSGEPLDVRSRVLWTMSAGRIDQQPERGF